MRSSMPVAVGGRTRIVYGFVATLPPSTARTVNVNAPVCVGTPLMTPAVRLSPGGNFPLVMLHEGAPENVRAAPYASPVCAGDTASDGGEIVPAATAGGAEPTNAPPKTIAVAIATNSTRALNPRTQIPPGRPRDAIAGSFGAQHHAQGCGVQVLGQAAHLAASAA